ncbi:hypothetical protein CAPTEDRAFT_142019 [Capitella teleta]|uniref:SAC domain-containing protein n=1 Tax=Capitella teleta TaxID=283909 RepID=R7TZR5_CAPTE|nr:hypothetical protein CAPTEDRAFT_142019 [Capitella teleta]|eukprot:ELT99122.1 hypothetical protein CAPTEDRAFT_142019 [Capitella teleta]
MQFKLISSIQKIVIYETKARFYVVGSNNIESRFRVLKIDRTEPQDLCVVDDKVEYTRKEIVNLLRTIESGNRTKTYQKVHKGLSEKVSAFGIVGFVRFLEGFYILLITKRRKVAMIGPHTFYKIEDTKMMYIPNDTVRYTHPDEQKYVKMFQNIDLSSNFYFSYSYDLTRTLQYNMTDCTLTDSDRENSPEKSVDDKVIGYCTPPAWKYVWNEHLLRPVLEEVHPDWLLHFIHGFIGQSKLMIYDRPVTLTLVARRSNQFAGTRFLKRGTNDKGSVANEVETEQIVIDASVSLMDKARLTSFVQLRGSIPLHWSQDVAKMVPKPPIALDQADPFGCVAGQHFNQIMRRYGAPIIVLNLVKKREKKPHESILTEEFARVIEYLNQFLPPEHSIKYVGFDMARVSKSKTSNVLHRLAEIAEYCVKKTGFYQSHPSFHCNKIRPHARQRGAVRTNCVDCLDRTNTAQFAIGKCALAFQLYSLGLLDSPMLDFDTDCARMLEDLYEGQGDTLALQYGGSQLVHRIKGYRKLAPWTSSSRDIMQTLSRYYSNAFSDADKQHAVNLFLGVYEPRENQLNLWELATDFYLHNKVCMQSPSLLRRSYTQWWDDCVYDSLPYAHEEVSKGSEEGAVVLRASKDDERVDVYWEHYRPYELTCLEDLFLFRMPNSTRDFMPKFAPTLSPFAPRVHPGRRQEEFGSTTEANPSVSGLDSTASLMSTGSEGSTDSSDSSDIEGGLEMIGDSLIQREESGFSHVSLKDLFPCMFDSYGVDIKPPNKHSTSSYKCHTQIGKNATQGLDNPATANSKNYTNLIQTSSFPMDSVFNVEPPNVNLKSKDVYQTFVRRGQNGPDPTAKAEHHFYHQYLQQSFQ